MRQPVFAAEINWNTLFQLVKRDKVAFKEMPKFPEVRRDFALLLDESVSYADLYRSSFKAGKKLLKQRHTTDPHNPCSMSTVATRSLRARSSMRSGSCFRILRRP